jgi:hypothetical protein
MSKGKNVVQYLILSLIAACLIFILTFFSSQKPLNYEDKLIVGGVYISCCIFGISLAIRPNWIKRLLRHTNTDLQNRKAILKNHRFLGHHPDCNHFTNHIIKINKKSYCAGCFGLVIGSLISIFLMIFYIFNINGISPTINFIFPIVFILIALIFFEQISLKRHTILHVLSNILLIICFFIIIISILEITGDIRYSLIGILLSFLWLDTRIQLSRWQHTRICLKCKKSCKIYL